MRVNLRGPPHTSHVFLNRCLTHTNPFAPHPPVPFNACPRSLYLRAGCPSVPRPRPGSGACLSLSAATHSRLGLNRPRPRPPPSACVPSAPQSAAQAVSTLDYASIIGGELPEAPIYRPPSLICCLSPGGAAGPFPRRFGRYVSLVSIVCGCMHGWLLLAAGAFPCPQRLAVLWAPPRSNSPVSRSFPCVPLARDCSPCLLCLRVFRSSYCSGERAGAGRPHHPPVRVTLACPPSPACCARMHVSV